MTEYYAEGIGRVGTCPCCLGNIEDCNRGPWPGPCSPRREPEPDDGPGLEVWPTVAERDGFAIWEAGKALERLNPNLLSPAWDRWLAAYDKGDIA